VAALVGASNPLTGQHTAAPDAARPRFILERANERMPVDLARSPTLRRPITLALSGVRLADAIAEISRQSGLAIVFSDDVVPANARVDLLMRDVSVADALTSLLSDRGLDIVMRPNGSASLVPRRAPPAPLVATIAGKVTASGSGEPLEGVSVFVDGSGLGATTQADGTYRIAQVVAGTRTIVARRVGYSPQRRSVAVADGQETTVDFELSAVATSLEAVVTTATGQQRRIELGNSVAAVDVTARIESAPVKSFGELLNAQAPGVQVQVGNSTGATSRVRIRGISSTALSNDPIYIIDGVRMTNTIGGAGTGGGSVPSRVNDINPEEIESIEVVKGPSAATLYGTDAANGVIVLTTRRGRAGAPIWSFHAEGGQNDDRNDYLAQYALLGKSPNTTAQRRCFSYELPTGACVLDSATVLNLWEDPDLTPLKPGWRTVLGGSVSGGTPQLRYYLAADSRREDGPFGLPKFDERRFKAQGVELRDEMKRPSHQDQFSARANLNAAVTPKFDVAVSAGLIRGTTRFPQNDNNTSGFVYNAVAGPGYAQGPGYSGVGPNGVTLFGYAQMTPGQSFQRLSEQSINRLIGSTTADWRPLTWLTTSGDVGLDLTDRRDFSLQRLGEGPPTGTLLQGSASDGRVRIENLTINGRATASWQITSELQLRSSGGAQFVGFDLNSTTATGTQLAPGGEAPNQGAVYSIAANSSPSKTLGAYIEEQLAIRDRLFITAALRTDRNSAFGVDYGSAYYPKASMSWIVSEEGFFPKPGFLNQLRLRASIGSAGVQPGPTSSLRTYATSNVYFLGATVAGLTQSNPGNASLKPETSTEFEAGFDSRWFSDRVNLEFTGYRKRTSDALISQPVAPSAGISSYLANLGGMQNAGVEYRIQAQLVDRRSIGWDVSFGGSKNDNKVTALGPIATTPTSAIQVGKPVYAVFQRKIRYDDANKDGLLTFPEVTISAATDVEYLGQAVHPTQMMLTSNLELFDRRLRVTVLVDRKAGGRLQNLERQLPCLVGTSCPELHRLNSSLDEQARGIALRQGVFAGYSEDNDFTKLREVSASYDLSAFPIRRWIGAKTARITASARNLVTWTDWTGSDPEGFIATGQDSPAASQSVLTVSPPRYVMLRLNFTY